MSIIEIVAAGFSIIASIIAISADIKARNNETELKKIRQIISDNQIEDSNINQAAGNIHIENNKR